MLFQALEIFVEKECLPAVTSVSDPDPGKQK
jgi:hypothetical protein